MNSGSISSSDRQHRGSDRLAPSGGVTAVIGGLIWTGFFIWYVRSGVEANRLTPVLWVLIPALLAMAWTFWGLSRSERARNSRIGLLICVVGAGLLCGGLLGVSLLRVGAAWLIGILGELTLSIGLLVFGLANLQEKLLPAFNVLPLLILLLYVPSWMVDPGALPAFLPRDLTEWLAVGTGVGWILLGGLLLLARQEQSFCPARHCPADGVSSAEHAPFPGD